MCQVIEKICLRCLHLEPYCYSIAIPFSISISPHSSHLWTKWFGWSKSPNADSTIASHFPCDTLTRQQTSPMLLMQHFSFLCFIVVLPTPLLIRMFGIQSPLDVILCPFLHSVQCNVHGPTLTQVTEGTQYRLTMRLVQISRICERTSDTVHPYP